VTAAAAIMPARQSAQRRRLWAVIGLTGPAYVWLAFTVLLPLSAMLYFSFLTVAPIGARIAEPTLDNYLDFFRKGFYMTLTGRSLWLGVWVTALCLALGFPAAFALAKHVKGRWREALFLLVVLPFWSNALVRTFSWTMVLRSDGLVDRALQALVPGLPHLDLLFTFAAVVIGLVHSFLPYMILTCYISLQAIDDSLLEAARSLGAAGPTVFRRILLPLSLPGILAGTILIFVPVIGSFMEPRILGGRGGFMLGNVIEDQFTVVFNWPLGAALSFILLAIVLLILAAFYPLLRRNLQGLA
jgi:spermidine/putrescine transport system permease protein